MFIHEPRRFSQIFPTDQSVSSYSSNPSTPVSSPPPLTGSAPGWAPGAAPVSPHFTADPNRGIHMVRMKVTIWIFLLITENLTNRQSMKSLHRYSLSCYLNLADFSITFVRHTDTYADIYNYNDIVEWFLRQAITSFWSLEKYTYDNSLYTSARISVTIFPIISCN